MHVSNRNYAFWTYSVRAEKEKVRVLRLVSTSTGLGRNAKMKRGAIKYWYGRERPHRADDRGLPMCMSSDHLIENPLL